MQFLKKLFGFDRQPDNPYITQAGAIMFYKPEAPIRQIKLESKVRWSAAYIKDWIMSHSHWECHQGGRPDAQIYSDAEYDQEILLAMFTLMNEPVYGEIKGLGADENTFLVFMSHAGCRYWGYCEKQDLVLLD